MTKQMFEFVPPATRFVRLPPSFAMKRGGSLNGARIAYESWGTPSPSGDNTILILTGLSPDAHAAAHPADPRPGWWDEMVGPHKPIDTSFWHVICVNALGSCKGSTGPASLNPLTGQTYRLDFPALSIEDVADAAAIAVQALGFKRLACVVGASMGGMTALALLLRHPGLARSLINISGAAAAQAFAIAIRSLQREAVRRDPCWREGYYDEARYPEAGMAAARKLGIISYRGVLEWEDRFGRRRLNATGTGDPAEFGPEFEVESYLESHACRFRRNYDPNCYLYLSRAMDWFDIEEGRGCGLESVLSEIAIESALIIGVENDILFPLWQQRQIADGLSAGGVETRFLPLESPHGHDAFLIDMERFGPAVRDFLSGLAISKTGPKGSKAGAHQRILPSPPASFSGPLSASRWSASRATPSRWKHQ